MADHVEFADVEQFLIDHLAVDEPVSTFAPTDPDTKRPGLGVRVERTGGPRDRMVDVPTVVVEAWGLDEGQAIELMGRVRSAMEALARTTHDGHKVQAVTETGGPANLPDPLSTHARYTATYELRIRGAVTP